MDRFSLGGVYSPRSTTASAAFSTGVFATMSVACSVVILDALALTAIAKATTRSSFMVFEFYDALDFSMKLVIKPFPKI